MCGNIYGEMLDMGLVFGLVSLQFPFCNSAFPGKEIHYQFIEEKGKRILQKLEFLAGRRITPKKWSNLFLR